MIKASGLFLRLDHSFEVTRLVDSFMQSSLIKKRWLSNSFVNLVGGIASAGINLLLPAVVVRHFSSEMFSLWNLALQIFVYVNLISLGLQTATARAIAHAAEFEHGGGERLAIVTRAARSISNWTAGLALAMVLVTVLVYPYFFHKMSPGLTGVFRWTIVLFGVAGVFQLLAQVEMGVFQGLHKNGVFVGAQVVARLIAVVLVWFGVAAHQTMDILPLLMAVGLILLMPMMRLALNRLPWANSIRSIVLDRACRRQLLHSCGTLSVWSVSMLLVNSVGILIVGRFDYSMVGSYSIAMTATTVVVGLLGAVLTPLLTTAAAMHGSTEGRKQLPELLSKSTFLVAIFLGLLLVVIMGAHTWLLRMWVGEQYVASTAPLLLVLVAAHCLRNIGAPYSFMLIATELNKRALFTAILEAGSNLVSSIILGYKWGAIGVALGTLVGSVVGIVGMYAVNTRNTPEISPKPMAFVANSVILPVAVFSPVYYFLLHYWFKYI